MNHESIKKSSLAWIELLNVPVEQEKSMLTVKIDGRRIDFWPASDTYYLHSKDKYGHGIQSLVERILQFKK